MIDLRKIEIQSRRDTSLNVLRLTAGIAIRSDKVISRHESENDELVEELKTALRYDIWNLAYGDLQMQARKAYTELYTALAREGWSPDKINVLLEENQKLLDMLKL